MQIRVRYFRARDLRADYDAQLSRGGLLLRVNPGEELQQFAAVKLELVAGPAVIALDAQVVQVFPIAGVAVTFERPRGLDAWREAATAMVEEDRDPEHTIVGGGAAERSRVEAASRIQTALRGSRDERAAILRENNPALHAHVLKNPGLQLDEVLAIAKMRTVGPELLKQVADRREWAQRPDIALALVRNPKTPVPLAIRLLDYVSREDLRQLAKDQHTRTPIQHAARKKVVG